MVVIHLDRNFIMFSKKARATTNELINLSLEGKSRSGKHDGKVVLFFVVVV